MVHNYSDKMDYSQELKTQQDNPTLGTNEMF